MVKICAQRSTPFFAAPRRAPINGQALVATLNGAPRDIERVEVSVANGTGCACRRLT
jgi:hypothetical protein